MPKFESIKAVSENEYEVQKFYGAEEQLDKNDRNEEINNRPGTIDDFDSNLPTVLPSSGKITI